MLKSLKKGLGSLLIVYAGLQSSYFAVSNIEISQGINYSKTKVVKKLNINKNMKIPKEYGVKEFLQIAHYLVASKLKYDGGVKSYNLDPVLDSGRGNCKHYSALTLLLFQELAKQNDRGDILDNVRFAGGVRTNSDESKSLHAWVEYYENGKWIPYEAVRDRWGYRHFSDSELINDLEHNLHSQYLFDNGNCTFRTDSKSFRLGDINIIYPSWDAMFVIFSNAGLAL